MRRGDPGTLRFIEKDGKKILQQIHEYQGVKEWVDVPCVEDKKEQRKLWEIIRCAHPVPDQGGHNQIYQHMASVSIDAVIECYEEWFGSDRPLGTFPEYLKEKLGNE